MTTESSACPRCSGPLRGGRNRPCSGRRFGVEATICAPCYDRLYNRAVSRPSRATGIPCDLCGAGMGSHCGQDGGPWGIEGTICAGCRDDLEDERLESVPLDLAAAAEGVTLGLPVVDGTFTWSDLTHRAACRALLASSAVRRAFRAGRAS